MTQYQLPIQPATPSPETRHMHTDLFESQAEAEFTRSDRQLLYAVQDFTRSHGFIIGELEPKQEPPFAHLINEYTTTQVNTRIEVLKNEKPIARVIAEPTVIDINRSKHFQAARADRLKQGLSVTVTDKSGRTLTMSSFPKATIDRNVDEFFAANGTDFRSKDAILRQKRIAALRNAQAYLFPPGSRGITSEYNPKPTVLRPQAAAYPQIAMYARLNSMFRALGLPTEADACEVLLAACGERLQGLANAAGAAAIAANFRTHMIQYPGEGGLPEGELPDKILPRRPKAIEEED